MPVIVALDIETTGLDPHSDAILEIGARRFDGHRTEDEWTTLVNPGRHIPEFITGLTGINDGMVRQAPKIHAVLGDLESFVGSAPILGQNIRFDLSFLQKHNLFALNDRLDTYEMASVLMPAAGRYNLGALGAALGIPLSATHRALDDARLTHAVFLRLFERAMELPLDLLAEIVRLSEPIEWDGAWALEHALSLRGKEKISAGRKTKSSAPLLVTPVEEKSLPPLKPIEGDPLPIDPDETAALLEHNSHFAQNFKGYEYRQEQMEMLRAVTSALSNGNHLMVEAGTGVGKSFAYLLPAALFALENNTRVVISTNTINLQDQLIKKDIPDLRSALDLKLRASVLKGRGNYLCPRRLEYLRRHGPRSAEEMRLLGKILVWLHEGGNGDRTEINLTGPIEREVWSRVSAEDEACSIETCIERMGGACPFYRARMDAQSAHLLIVNHALLLSDVITGNRILPEYQYLIVDEGHHLESATTNALSLRITRNDLERMMLELGGNKSGMLGFLLSAAQPLLRPSDFAQLNQMITRATDLAFRVEQQVRAFFTALAGFLTLQQEDQQPSLYAYQERIMQHTRTLPGWDEVEIAWSACGETLRLQLAILSDIHKNITQLITEGQEDLENAIGSLGSLYLRIYEVETAITSLINDPAHNWVYWVEINPNGNFIAINSAPLQIGPLVEEYLWHEKNCVILTSATLTANTDFAYIRSTLQADEANELALGSPFDYESAALLYLANDIAEPYAREHQSQLEETLVRLCRKTGGRTLVLFTSYAQLKRTARAITAPLAAHDIIVYEQGEGASPNTLLETFKSAERAVLLGTRSFWEGVDVPGTALSVLVIVKLPFDVPNDPLIAARSEMFEDPFNEYQLPEAILKFRQGFGRLIRTQSDRGVVVVLDRRVLTKSYGRAFLDSLPHCTVRVGSLSELPSAAEKWLGL